MDGIIKQNMVNQKVPYVVSRFDMAINFYCIIKKNNKFYLVTYYYNPDWDLYYPFYDDKNKTPQNYPSKAKKYSNLIKESDAFFNDPEKYLKLAQKRFKELIGCSCDVIPSTENYILYEVKYSKTANVHTIYKLFNYIITDVDDANKMLYKSLLPSCLFDIDHLDENKVVGNAVYFVNNSREMLKKYAIRIK